MPRIEKATIPFAGVQLPPLAADDAALLLDVAAELDAAGSSLTASSLRRLAVAIAYAALERERVRYSVTAAGLEQLTREPAAAAPDLEDGTLDLFFGNGLVPHSAARAGVVTSRESPPSGGLEARGPAAPTGRPAFFSIFSPAICDGGDTSRGTFNEGRADGR